MRHMTVNGSPRRWAVGNVHTGSEIDVANRLQGDGMETYCPRFEKPVRRRRQWHRRERETVVKAVFPGYLFVNADTIANLEAVYETPGFHYFIRNEDRLSLLHDAAIEALKALEGRGVLIATSVRELVAQFLPGDVVRVDDDGSWSGMTGPVFSQDEGSVVVWGGDFKYPTEMPAENLKLEE